MALKSTSDHYGTVAVSVRWLSALLILVLIGSGFRAANTMDPAVKAAILRVHIPLALAVLALTIVRIGWWCGWDRKPGPVGGLPRWQAHTAQLVHVLFYIVVLGMIASGIGMMVLGGAAPIIFDGKSALLPDFWKYPPRYPTRSERGFFSPCSGSTLLRLFIIISFAATVCFDACGSTRDRLRLGDRALGGRSRQGDCGLR